MGQYQWPIKNANLPMDCWRSFNVNANESIQTGNALLMSLFHSPHNQPESALLATNAHIQYLNVELALAELPWYALQQITN